MMSFSAVPTRVIIFADMRRYDQKQHHSKMSTTDVIRLFVIRTVHSRRYGLVFISNRRKRVEPCVLNCRERYENWL